MDVKYIPSMLFIKPKMKYKNCENTIKNIHVYDRFDVI
jgi:hypothetical protein